MVERQCKITLGFDRLIQSQLPMGRIRAPEEIADAIIFLCSSRANWVNGKSLIVDGAPSIYPLRHIKLISMLIIRVAIVGALCI